MELEASRLVETRGWHGAFVIATRQRVVDVETRAAALIVARTAQRAGLSQADAVEARRSAW